MRVVIVHDWLVGGGAERVIQELHNMYPDAPIYTSYCTDEWRNRLDNKVITGWLQYLGWVRKFVPFLRIWWFSRLDLSGYDVVISSSGNGEALGVNAPDNALHINYCHAPTHFYWRFYDHYLKNPGFGFLNFLARLGLRIMVSPLRAWDHKAAQKADVFVANSEHIKSEIKHFYGRDAVVIHPPVDTKRFSNAKAGVRSGFITAGRQVPQKRMDIIIGACNELKLPLTVIGKGPEHDKLVKIAGKTVSFNTDVSDSEMAQYFSSAEAFLFASFEDFGVTPVEALAAGTPVVAYKAGGALDYIEPGKNGEFFVTQSVPSLCSVLKDFSPEKYSESEIKNIAFKFSVDNFTSKFGRLVNELYAKKQKK